METLEQLQLKLQKLKSIQRPSLSIQMEIHHIEKRIDWLKKQSNGKRL